MTLPRDDSNFLYRVGAIKSAFSRQHPKTEFIHASRESKQERGIRQKRFWEHPIHDDRDFANQVDDIHINPGKHGVAQRASDWPHSTIHHLSSTVWLMRIAGLTLAMASFERFDVGHDETQPNLRATGYALMCPAWITGLNAASLEAYR